ncbi:MAG TPA: serine/threonine-protein kinase [Gemmatimonadaceae bacterium]|nr:serine/threonine-protein kinase [Gemmatimonadaceae bacterium]
MTTFEERLKDSLSHAYEIERELGGGGMSRVFVATDRALGRRVVIKLLSPELTAGVNSERFRREIQVAAQLQHPHIVTLLSAGEDGDIFYYTMPYIEGESLRSALAEHGAMSVREVIRIMCDVVDALGYAHARGVVHRDIKPGNILRSGQHSLVTDFGVAKALNAAMPSSGITSTGVAIGTPAYMAPEQLAGDPAADHRLDIYAVGLLAYELLIGQSPFAALSPQATMAAQLTRDPEPLSQFRKDVPPALSAIIMKCLAKLPDERYQNATALAAALDGVVLGSGEVKTGDQVVLPAVKKRRTKFLVGGIAVLILAPMVALFASKKVGGKPIVTTSTPPQATFVAAAPVAAPAAPTVMTAPVVAPVITKADSLAIEAAVQKRLASEQTQAQAQALKKGKAPIAVNEDSIRRAVQKSIADSIARATPPAAPARAVVVPVEPVAPAPSGKKRVAITEPKEGKVAALNSFSRTLTEALRGSLSKEGGFILIDQDSVRSALATAANREDIIKDLQPDVLITHTFAGVGVSDTVSIIVTVRDLRASSSFGIRVTSAKMVAANAEYYVGPVLQSILKQIDDLSRAPTIYRK